MRFKDYKEATTFVKALLAAKESGKRELLTARLDSVPAWSGVPKDPDKQWVPDGSEIEAVYLSYKDADDRQKEQAKPAKLAGVKLERISGRLVDVRRCKDGTCQVLFTNGLRDGQGEVPFRGPNIDKGILVCLSIGEGLGESVDEAIARVPQEMIDKLKAGKVGKRAKAKSKKALQDNMNSILKAELDKNSEEALPVVVSVRRTKVSVDVPSVSDEVMRRLK